MHRAEAAAAPDGVYDFWDGGLHQPSPLSALCGTSFGLGGLSLAEYLLRVHGWRWGIGFFGFERHEFLLYLGAFGALSALVPRCWDRSDDPCLRLTLSVPPLHFYPPLLRFLVLASRTDVWFDRTASRQLFGAPAAPLGRPKVTVQGFALVVSLAMLLHYVNLACGHYLGIQLPMEVEQVLAPALGIAAMLYFQMAIHPPAAACSIQYMVLSNKDQQGPSFLLMPVLVGVVWMLFTQQLTAVVVKYMKTIKPAEDSKPSAAKADAQSPGDDPAEAHVSVSFKKEGNGSKATRIAGASSEQQGYCSDDSIGSASSFASSHVSSRVSSRAPSPPPSAKKNGTGQGWTTARAAGLEKLREMV